MSDRVKVIGHKVLARGWSSLTNYTLDYTRRDGAVQRLQREVYDHGGAAAILLFDPDRDTVLLVRQYRFPPSLNGDDPEMLEVCAGLLDGDDPRACAIREAIEETGHEPENVRHVCDVYTSPGAVTEKTSFFIGHYHSGTRRNEGGGLKDEGEEIELVELPLPEALSMIADGRIVDLKTVALLQHLALHR